jgi:resuscitation-promoting factor RpfB
MGGSGGPLPGSSAWPSSFAGPAQYSPSYSAIDAAEDTATEATGYGESYAPYAEATAEYADPYAPSYPHGDSYRYEYETEAYSYDYPTNDGYAETDYFETDVLEEPLSSTSTVPGPRTTGDRARFAPESDTHYAPGTDLDFDPGPASAPEFDPEPQPQQTRHGSSRRGGSTRVTTRRTTLGGRVVQGLVLAALLGGVTAYVTLDKTVNISVDGSIQQIHSFASTVGAVLASDDVSTDGHDLVTPGPAAALVDDATITVRYGRPLNLTVDGTARHVWVHSRTVDTALQELGVRIQGANISVPGNAPIGRAGMAFTVFTMRHITFLVDGKSVPLDTTAPTVSAAMGQAGIVLHNQDTASVPAGSLPVDGETISILRITGTTKVEQVSIPYSVTQQSDPTSYVGSTTIVTPGVNGVAQVTYAFQTVNGVAQPQKETSRVVTKQPVNEVEKVGTKALPTDVSALNWAALANCESGGNPKAVDPSGTYYGLYQFSVSTWESLGGAGLPSNASSAEQTTRAELLYQRSGAGQWPVCGHNLFS